jgi:hypothetical protein
MENKLLRFLGTAYLLLHSQSLLANARASEEKLKTKPEKGQQMTIVRQDEDREIKTFSGTIARSGDSFTLNDTTNKVIYQLDDAQKASQFDGKKVNVKGTLDSTRKLIHVQAIEEAT